MELLLFQGNGIGLGITTAVMLAGRLMSVKIGRDKTVYNPKMI
jgi:hypothetical protein